MSSEPIVREDERKPSSHHQAPSRMDELVGNTPLLRLQHIGDPDGAPIYVKLENQNPAGSVRDRYVSEIIERALLAGHLVGGDTVSLAGIDDSAVAAAFLSAVADVNCRIFAPEGSSRRLVPLIQRYGAEIEWTSDEKGLSGAIDEAARWARDVPDRLYVAGHRRQAVRDAYQDIATEILDALGPIPLGGFVTSVTTGATFREVSSILQERHPIMKLAGAQIIENEFATTESIRQVVRVTLDEAWEMRNLLARREGLLLSPKGAACVKLALEMQPNVLADQAIVALNPDAGQRYLGWENKSLYKATFEDSTGE